MMNFIVKNEFYKYIFNTVWATLGPICIDWSFIFTPLFVELYMFPILLSLIRIHISFFPPSKIIINKILYHAISKVQQPFPWNFSLF